MDEIDRAIARAERNLSGRDDDCGDPNLRAAIENLIEAVKALKALIPSDATGAKEE